MVPLGSLDNMHIGVSSEKTMSKTNNKVCLSAGTKITHQQWLNSATVISLGSGFHGALNKEMLHCMSKTPGFYLPTAEEVTRVF